MKRHALFLKALELQLYKKYRWIQRAFQYTRGDEITEPYFINYDGIHAYVFDEQGVRIDISDFETTETDCQPVFKMNKDLTTLKKGDLPNIKVDAVKTSYGQALMNAILLVYPFGNKIAFMNPEGGITGNMLEKEILKLYKVYPPGVTPPEGEITTTEYLKFQKASYLVTSLTQTCVPSASRKTMTPHPKMKEFVASLMKKYEGQLHDPAILAQMDKEIVDFDSEYLKGDSSEGFFIKGKLKNVSRKKLFGTFGGESAFTDGTRKTLIAKPLIEGIDVKQYPTIINASREGSYDRGAETALGGEAVKRILQLLQNSKLVMDDCGSTLGMDDIVSDLNKNELIGLNIIEGSKLVRLTDDNITRYMGKSIVYRTTAFCKAPNANYCKTCIGEKYENNPTGLASAGSRPASIFMDIFMSSMHGTTLKTVPYNFRVNMR